MFMDIRNETFALRGSISELRAKLRILKNRLPFMDDEEKEKAAESIERMYGEFAKYSSRADEIYLEYDVSDISGMDEDQEEWASGSEEGPDA